MIIGHVRLAAATTVILHHCHIQPVLIRDWSPKMDGITATIWASKTTGHPKSWTPAQPSHGG